MVPVQMLLHGCCLHIFSLSAIMALECWAIQLQECTLRSTTPVHLQI